MSFADELKAWRRRKGLTQKEAAAHLGVEWRTYEGWEHGRFEPKHVGLIRRALDAEARASR